MPASMVLHKYVCNAVCGVGHFMFGKEGSRASLHVLQPGVITLSPTLHPPGSPDVDAFPWPYPFKRWRQKTHAFRDFSVHLSIPFFPASPVATTPAPFCPTAGRGTENQQICCSSLPAAPLTSQRLVACWYTHPSCRMQSGLVPSRKIRSFSSVIISKSRKTQGANAGGQQSARGSGRKRYRRAVNVGEEEGERNDELGDDGLPRLVRKAVEASFSPRSFPISFWEAQAEQALRLLPSLLPFHLASLLLAYARAGVRHPPLAAAIVHQFAEISSRQRYHPLLLSPRSIVYANALVSNGKSKKRSAKQCLTGEIEEERQRVDFAAFSTVLLSLERLHLLHHPLVHEPAERLQCVLLHRLQGECDSFSFRHLKRLMLLLAKLSAVDSTRCSRRADGNPAGGTSRGPAEGRQYSSTDIQRLRYEETGCEEGEVRRPLENRGFLVEVMVAAAEKALEADRPPADAVKKVTLDDREMFPVVWCITRFDQMIFSKFARKRTDVSMGEIPLGGTPSEVFQSSVRRRERTRSEQADEAHETPSRDKTCPVDTEEDDGFSYKFVLGGMAHHHSEDELTKDVVDMYMQARAKLLRRATQGVRTIIVSRLRCAPLDAAMALDAYLLFKDQYMSTKTEHYFSFVLSNATFEELLTLADGFRHLRIAQERVWNVWCQQVERRLSLHACQDSSWEDRRDPPLRPPSLETLQAVRGWFQLLGRPCPLIEALLAQVTVRAEQ
ncbi:hypothetical protein TGRUB_209460 [Toxoplasma gondii RUB]|uniref:Uncharacterized protein n=6 Tax=Toxoplasma gondii TaxID=5811 RepID=A0A125YRA9_TOXGV|nr:hypothetical protein TGGT1_209460 [Toxoplasma gondii GT1]ESS29526.1 hypothetical protein TGVEG_209460 [Toxoplasma gondii VEG]KAF4645900.1 hypothetical protein TGRH88_021760 [Toxoplasma gondii]KFG60508.1 hypothetical protein TGRUB_209460 [Toxoplasma gondii RUB]PUA88181.1 hypothetical protein TGBR9_209460 [Toxoplasma gondii TgCATBr9]